MVGASPLYTEIVTMMENNKIISKRDKFTSIPNIVDEMGLSTYAIRLYMRIKRRAGDVGGACWESTKNLAAGCQMSVGSVVKAKRELQEAGLIQIETKDNPKGGKPYHEINVVDIWPMNSQYFTSSSSELASSLGEPKKNPLRRARSKRKKASRSSPHYPAQSENEFSSSAGQYNMSSASSLKNHPGIQTIKDVTGYYPRKVLWEPIIEFFKENELDVDRLRSVFTLWVAQGYDPMNIEGWLFEWYPNDAYYTNPDNKEVLEYLKRDEIS